MLACRHGRPGGCYADCPPAPEPKAEPGDIVTVRGKPATVLHVSRRDPEPARAGVRAVRVGEIIGHYLIELEGDRTIMDMLLTPAEARALTAQLLALFPDTKEKK